MASKITRDQVDGQNIVYLPNTNDMYAVSRDGQVYSFSIKMNGKAIGAEGPKGYTSVAIYYDNGEHRTEYVHRLVAKMFLPAPPDEKYQVSHINEDNSDNRVENLEYVSCEENLNQGTHNKNLSDAIKKFYANRNIFGKIPMRVKVYDDKDNLLSIEPSIRNAANFIEEVSGKPASSNAVQISSILAGKSGFKTVGGFTVQSATEEEYKAWVAEHMNTLIQEEDIEISDVQLKKLTKVDGVKIINRRLDMKTGEISCIVDEYGKGDKVTNQLY